MSEFRKITFSKPVVTTGSVTRTKRSEVLGVQINGKPLTSMPDEDLRVAITQAAAKEGNMHIATGSYPEIKDGIGVRVRPLELA